MFDYTNIDHLYVYHHNKHKVSSNQKSFEIDVGNVLTSSLEIWSIIFLFCVHFILLRSMKFIQKSILTIDINSFILPEIGSISGLRHLENFLKNFTRNLKPLYVVAAEIRRQKNKLNNRRYREKNKDKIKISKRLYREHNQEKIKVAQSSYRERNRDDIRLYFDMYYENNKPKILEKRKSLWKTTCGEKRRHIENYKKSNTEEKNSDNFSASNTKNTLEEIDLNILGHGLEQSLEKIMANIDKRICHATTVFDEKKSVDEKNSLPNPNFQRANICVVCDRLIIGMEEVKQISKEQLTENADRLSVTQYEEHFSISLKQELVVQYQVEDFDLKDLLLSPRAQRSSDEKFYQCCSACYNSVTKGKKEEGRYPPKFSIANGFAIGHIPNILRYRNKSGEMQSSPLIDPEKHFDDIFCAAISPVRPFGYVHAYSGGKQKSIKGHFSFFSVDQSHVGGVLNKYRNIKNSAKNIFVVLCGRMTPDQKKIVQRQVCLLFSLFYFIV